jgi:hypothetical protein
VFLVKRMVRPTPSGGPQKSEDSAYSRGRKFTGSGMIDSSWLATRGCVK